MEFGTQQTPTRPHRLRGGDVYQLEAGALAAALSDCL